MASSSRMPDSSLSPNRSHLAASNSSSPPPSDSSRQPPSPPRPSPPLPADIRPLPPHGTRLRPQSTSSNPRGTSLLSDFIGRELADMPLLTPSETMALEGFLNNVSFTTDVYSPEWGAIVAAEHPHVEDDPQQKEYLARATKDLMSLNYANRAWPDPDPRLAHGGAGGAPPPFGASFLSPAASDPSWGAHFFSSSRLDLSSFRPQMQQQQQQQPQLPQQAYPHANGNPSSFAAPSSGPLTVLPPHLQSLPRTRSDVLPMPAGARQRAATVDGVGRAKRAITESGLLPSPKRRRPSLSIAGVSPTATAGGVPPPVGKSTSSTSSSSSRLPTPTSAGPSAAPTQSNPNSNASNATGKPALLSPSQKKANHIQSEQKRRANIRRGYEALCDSVPALREAIAAQEAEEAAAAAAAAASSGARRSGGGGAHPPRKKRVRSKAGDDGERLDGRAGPKSEYVVLQKSIDYIVDLQAEREALLARLARVRNVLQIPPDATKPDGSKFAWECEWNGGSAAEEEDEESD